MSPQQAPQEVNIESLITLGIEKGLTVDTMERLMAMRRELKSEKAKELYDEAMSLFQIECPIIEKKKKVLNKNSTTTRYAYAPLDKIVEQVKALIQKHGFSYTFKTEVEDVWVKAVCIVKHKYGHSETSDFKIPIDKDAYMNGPQQFASALTFGKRYAFCNAFGILTADEDNNSNSVPPVENTVDKIITVTKQFVAKATIEQLEDYKDKLVESKKYTPAQKSQLLEIVNERINEIVPA